MATRCKTRPKDILLCAGDGNASGIVPEIQLIPIDHVVSIPDPDADTYVISGDFVLEADTRTAAEIAAGDPVDPIPAVFTRFQFKETGANYTTSTIGDEEDNYVEHQVVFKIPKRSAEKSQSLDQIKGREFLVLFTDRNRYQSVFGDTKEGMRFTILPTTDGNGYEVTGKYKAAREPYEYRGAVVTRE